jgi:hypothetical protein
MTAVGAVERPVARPDLVLRRVGSEWVRYDTAQDRAHVLTSAAHLLVRGHPVLGDDLVRFAPGTLRFSAVYRSLKLDDKSLYELPLLA